MSSNILEEEKNDIILGVGHGGNAIWFFILLGIIILVLTVLLLIQYRSSNVNVGGMGSIIDTILKTPRNILLGKNKYIHIWTIPILITIIFILYQYGGIGNTYKCVINDPSSCKNYIGGPGIMKDKEGEEWKPSYQCTEGNANYRARIGVGSPYGFVNYILWTIIILLTGIILIKPTFKLFKKWKSERDLATTTTYITEGGKKIDNNQNGGIFNFWKGKTTIEKDLPEGQIPRRGLGSFKVNNKNHEGILDYISYILFIIILWWLFISKSKGCGMGRLKEDGESFRIGSEIWCCPQDSEGDPIKDKCCINRYVFNRNRTWWVILILMVTSWICAIIWWGYNYRIRANLKMTGQNIEDTGNRVDQWWNKDKYAAEKAQDALALERAEVKKLKEAAAPRPAAQPVAQPAAAESGVRRRKKKKQAGGNKNVSGLCAAPHPTAL